MTRDPEKRRRPKVVMFLTNPFVIDSRVLKEARSAAADGFDVTVLCMPKPGLPPTERRDGFTVVRLGRYSNLRVVRRLPWYGRCLAWCLRHRPCIIHVNDLDPLPTGWLAARLTSAGLVYDSHELWSQGRALSTCGPIVQRLVRKVERFLAARTDANFQADTARAEFFARQYRLPQPRTLSNCTTLQEVDRTDRLREMTGLGPDQRIMLYSGSISAGRGVEPTLKAVELLPENVHMVFLGHGAPEVIGAVDAFVRSSPVGHRVHRLPPVPYDQIIPVVGSADVGLSLIQNTNLSYYLGVPNKLFEYMMAGVPTVASNFPEMSAVVNDVGFGLLVDPESPREIADAVTRILDTPGLYRQFRENALRGRRKYCWETQVEGLLSEYRRIARTRGCTPVDCRLQ